MRKHILWLIIAMNSFVLSLGQADNIPGIEFNNFLPISTYVKDKLFENSPLSKVRISNNKLSIVGNQSLIEFNLLNESMNEHNIKEIAKELEFPDISLYDAIVDTNNVWFNTNQGVLSWSFEKKDWMYYDFKLLDAVFNNGHYQSNTMLIDDKIVWVSTDYGLIGINKKTQEYFLHQEVKVGLTNIQLKNTKLIYSDNQQLFLSKDQYVFSYNKQDHVWRFVPQSDTYRITDADGFYIFQSPTKISLIDKTNYVSKKEITIITEGKNKLLTAFHKEFHVYYHKNNQFVFYHLPSRQYLIKTILPEDTIMESEVVDMMFYQDMLVILRENQLQILKLISNQ